MITIENIALDQSDILLFKEEFTEIKEKKDASLWTPFIKKLQRVLIYYSDKYPYDFENIGKKKVPGDFEKKTIHKLIEDVIEIV